MRRIWLNLRWFLQNVLGGLRLALPVPVSRRSFHVSGDHALLLVFASIAVEILATQPMPGVLSHFNSFSWAFISLRCFADLVICYLVARIQKMPHTLAAMVVVLFSTDIAFEVFRAAFVWSGTPYWRWMWDDRTRVLGWTIFALLAIWKAATLARSLRLVYAGGRLRAAMLGAAIFGASWLATWMPLTTSLWHVARAADKDSSNDADAFGPYIDTERTYYAQQPLLSQKLAGLARHRPGAVNLYFVGFAGTSTQDVFLKETQSVQALFDERFDTRNRSLILVNNPRTVDDVPIASISNLRRALAGVARKMDREEDILFLFLTSHGSGHVFSVSFPQLMLNSLSDRELRDMLDDARIKWRVIAISACYSGSFIDALRDDHTLIVTAAAQDRTSFGCSNENDFTYFGDAYFNQALRRERSFVAAFARARELIAEREHREQLTPSEPQIYVGRAIAAKLQALESRLGRNGMASARAP